MSYETIYAQAHAWVVAVTGYAAAKVIPSDDVGDRPALPYITIGVTSYDQQIGSNDDVRMAVSGGILQETQVGARRASLSIQEYMPKGSQNASPTIEGLARTLQLSSVQALLTAFNVESVGPVRRVPIPLATHIEMRYAVDVSVVYSDASSAGTVPSVATIAVEGTLTGEYPDLTFTASIDEP